MELEAVEVKEAMLYPLPVKEATEAVEVLEAVEPVEVNLWTCVAEVKVGFQNPKVACRLDHKTNR
jgi:hypothetical protein